MTHDEARNLALAAVHAMPNGASSPLVLMDEYTTETPRAWIFIYNTELFAQTRRPLDGVVGNGPVLIDKATGAVHIVPSGGWKRWLEEFERTGIAPAQR